MLRFQNNEHVSFVLIDCGSFRNSNASAQFMNDVAKHIKSTVGDHGLQMLVATHQHNDHMSGFKHAQKVFESIGIEQVILSWLDNPKDPLAKEIADKHKKINDEIKRLHGLLKRQRNNTAKELRQNIGDLVDQLSISSNAVTEVATRFLREAGTLPIKYVDPGDVLTLAGIPSSQLRIHVLGPPKDYKAIRDTSPNKGESYDPHLDSLLFSLNDFVSALEPGGDDHYPFNLHYKSKASKNAGELKSYYNQDWRTIDHDWLEMGERLALHLNSFTNNSSIALAFQLVESEKFLLFVGDAQVGNWKTWSNIPRSESDPNLDFILANTVLYKVGHHGSHNATLKPAMDQMNHNELVALIPVNRNDPHLSKPKPWRMPAKNLYRELKKKTGGRILRMDEGKIKHPAVQWPRQPVVKESYVEYEVR